MSAAVVDISNYCETILIKSPGIPPENDNTISFFVSCVYNNILKFNSLKTYSLCFLQMNT